MNTTVRDTLLDLFNSGKELDKATLAEEVGKSGRQLQRFLDELRSQGAKIQTRRAGARVLYFIPEEHRQVPRHPVKLTREQLLALAVAARAAEATLEPTPLIDDLKSANVEVLAALEKDSGLAGTIDLREEADCWYFPGAPDVSIRAEVLATIRQGMCEMVGLEIDYHSVRSGRSRRRVDPYSLAHRDGSWFLCAWCRRNEEVRTFALADIHAAELLDPARDVTAIFPRREFTPSTLFDNTFYVVGGTQVRVRLAVAPAQTRAFLRKNYHPNQKVRTNTKDGSITVSFVCAGLDEVRSFVLGWGDGVTVLEPAELRRQVREQALLVAEKYRE